MRKFEKRVKSLELIAERTNATHAAVVVFRDEQHLRQILARPGEPPVFMIPHNNRDKLRE